MVGAWYGLEQCGFAIACERFVSRCGVLLVGKILDDLMGGLVWMLVLDAQHSCMHLIFLICRVFVLSCAC